MADQEAVAGEVAPKTRVFISYSRKDSAFADRLCTSLVERGYQPFLDREDISGGEAWKERLEALILQADAVAFVISPDSVASRICDWETNRTLELGKRLIPLLLRPIESGAAPPQLSRLNYIHVDTEEKLETGLRSLCAACDVDIAWVREHTRMVDLASRWDVGGRRADAVLRGAELAAAEAWLSGRQPLAPSVPEHLLDFLQAGRALEVDTLKRERANIQRTRRLQLGVSGLVALAAIVVVLAGLGAARMMSGLGEQRSRTLAEFAKQASDEGRYDRAARFALAGLIGADTPLTGFAAHQAESQLRRALAGPLTGVLRGHTGEVRSVAFSEDGARIATASADGTARIWAADSGRLVATLRGAADNPETTLKEGFFDAQFSPDGAYLVTASDAEGAQVWDIVSEAVVLAFGAETGMRRAAFSQQGDRVVTASSDGAARVWDVAGPNKGREVRTIGLGGFNTTTAISPDGSILLTSTGLRGGSNGQPPAQTWSIATGSQILSLRPFLYGGQSAVFDRDASRILTSSMDGIVRVWNARTGEMQSALPPLEESEHVVEFDPDGTLVASGTESGIIRIWHLERQRELVRFTGHEGGVTRVAFSPNGHTLASASSDGAVRLWRVPSDGEALGAASSAADTTRTVFSADGDRALTGVSGVAALLWLNSGASPPIALPHYFWSNGADLSRDGHWSAVGYYDDGLRTALYDSAGRLVTTLEGYRPVFSRDSTRLATSTDAGAVYIWSISRTPHRLLTRAPPQATNAGSVESLKFSPDGRRIVSVYGDTRAMVWDTETGDEIAVLPAGILKAEFNSDATEVVTTPSYAQPYAANVWRLGDSAASRALGPHDNEIFDAAFSPDGARIITASGDFTARIWDMRSPTEPLVLRGHGGGLLGAAFHPTLPLALTWSWDGTARIWSSETGLELARLDGHPSGVRSAAFTADGRRVMTAAGVGGAPRQWIMPYALFAPRRELERSACATVLRNGASRFTPADLRAAVVLDPVLDEDVCAPPSLWDRVTFILSPRS